MKKGFLSVLICAFGTILHAQAPAWLWAKSATSSGIYGSGAQGVAVDASGNAYVVGSFQASSVNFGAGSLTNAGGWDVFVVKYNAAGVVQWARRAGGLADDIGSGVGVDGAGNCYVTGHYNNEAQFGNITLSRPNSSTSTGYFLVKYSPAGAVLWAKTNGIADGGYAVPRALAVDKAGNSYTTGYAAGLGVVRFGSLASMPCNNTQDIFVVKHDASGAAVWARLAGGGSYAECGYGIATDTSGACFVTGDFQSTSLNFGNGVTLGTAGGTRFFAVKYDASGNAAWARTSGMWSGGESAAAVAADDSGYSYVVGNFGSGFAVDTFAFTNGGYGDIFILKYSPDGTLKWARHIGGPAMEQATAIAVDSFRRCYVAGNFFGDSMRVGNTLLLNSGGFGIPNNSNDLFAARLDTAGQGEWARNVGAPGSTLPRGVATDRVGNSYWAGNYGSPSPVVFGSTSLTNNGVQAAFTAKIATCVPPVPVISQSPAGTLNTAGPYLSYQWYHNGVAITGATAQTYTATQSGAYYVVAQSSTGCTGQSAAITVTITSSVEVAAESRGIDAHPNPLKNEVMVRLPLGNAGNLRVTDVLGQAVWKLPVVAGIREVLIDTRAWSTGIYLLHWEEPTRGAVTLKLVKE